MSEDPESYEKRKKFELKISKVKMKGVLRNAARDARRMQSAEDRMSHKRMLREKGLPVKGQPR